MYPGHWAEIKGDSPALVMAGSGDRMTWQALDGYSNRIARLLRDCGLDTGDHVALIMENRLDYLAVGWAAFRSGLYITCINRYLTTEEAAYIVEDSGARALIASAAVIDPSALAAEIPNCPHRFLLDGEIEDWIPFDAAVAPYSTDPLPEEPMGDSMLYSSGTTGRPKGISRPLPHRHVSGGLAMNPVLKGLFRVEPDSVYLSPAPMYHSAPLGFCTSMQSLGGTVIMMDRFDPREALRALDRYAVTHSQWVPTMFSRMLKLPEEERKGFDLSAHRVAIHAAAPCPRKVKQQMFEWWGPILHEYYGGTELNGLTYVDPEDWLAHPGTVGRAVMGTIRICDESGEELPTGEPGIVYFEREKAPFAYHNDAEKTRSAQHPKHPTWTALGDVGYVDEEGFLYLSDRASFMIISGGVNIYPQEVENELILHPKVEDVAVVGVPHEEFGEEVKAVVQPVAGVEGDEALAEELMAWARAHLAAYKCPRSVDFERELPRLPTGKLYKRLLKDRYWGRGDSKIVQE
jgi:fatty-acyl-CoA synthase